ncbi:MAG: hypothetical protein BAX61_10935 [Psychrobacter sp. B29-1]|uniref:hypothetical protein n=1 Tax=Psychrobacter sp. B29-1 TaxID=1867800 RepID=UPI00086ED125|nr:hypothetical protein [Psychrobacter sp. B29-1]OEH67435.1 MAG: hypothetical protein BAX61_10935 [Psychrobacter sp. B29-1]
MTYSIDYRKQVLSSIADGMTIPYSPDLNPIEKKWAQAKFLRQGWMENNLPKLFHDMGCIDFIKI